MKFIALLIALVLTLSATVQVNTNQSQSTSYQQTSIVRGYFYSGGSYKKIDITLKRTQFGYQMTQWEVVNPLQHGYAYSWAQEQANILPLNINNQMAKDYNFTHYVKTMKGVVYLTLY